AGGVADGGRERGRRTRGVRNRPLTPYNGRRMAVPLTILTDPRRAEARRELAIAAGTRIPPAARADAIAIPAPCGGRGRCTSCRVKFVAGAIPPPTIGDEVQLGDALVREGYRLACQCVPIEGG